jgi:hypothetical protein
MEAQAHLDESHDVGTVIQTATITETKTVKSFKLQVSGLELFQSVSVTAILFDETKNYAGVRNFVIAGDEYLAWNNNDQYLVDLVAAKLGFTLA